jgi:hypothetical protein
MIEIIIFLIGSILGVMRGISQVNQNRYGIADHPILAYTFLVLRAFMSWFGFAVGTINFVTDKEDKIFLDYKVKIEKKLKLDGTTQSKRSNPTRSRKLVDKK